jgi:hypothetical protein
MTSSEFKKRIGKALESIGFVYRAKVFERRTSEVLALLEFQKSNHENLWFINIGLWLYALGEGPPSRVASAHLYFRLERLVPDLRQDILKAGALDDPGQGSAYEKLLGWIPTHIDDVLRRLQAESAMAEALRSGELTGGLVRAEARLHLEQVSGKRR